MAAPEVMGVIVVRAWLEDSDPRRFRARITSTFELEGGPEQGEVVGSPQDALAAVARWLERFGGDVTPP
ncbi:hypothetical protein OM076_38805 [Solirubrobacter ginsenosidimutans]|uniref:Uncharacterized protein n=1 Tax=Solirubrobacter ginsenosidimutans TaxID=490573 RepID=A0A9X3N3C6_9ACTN|nr:hypothetical protein [Solirubrobacter ginsenosidimutans]MDA0166280.1 hypothetical protein [Solirubrobacter ginsenosidimutans]